MSREADTSHYAKAETELWEQITARQNSIFHMAKGLEFEIEIRGTRWDYLTKMLLRNLADMH